jgi:hypothetical protein
MQPTASSAKFLIDGMFVGDGGGGGFRLGG